MPSKSRFHDLRESIELADCQYILEELVKYNATVESDRPSPVVDLLLSNGSTLRGTPFKMLHVNSRHLFAFQTLETTRDIPPTEIKEIAFIDCIYIVSLKVHEPLKWRHQLTFGKVAEPLNEEVLTRLNAKRAIAEEWTNAKLEIALQIEWDQFSQDGFENNHLRRLAKEVATVLQQLMADDLGAGALAPVKSFRIVFSKTGVLEAGLSNGVLSLTTDALGTNVSTANVKAAIEAAL